MVSIGLPPGWYLVGKWLWRGDFSAFVVPLEVNNQVDLYWFLLWLFSGYVCNMKSILRGFVYTYIIPHLYCTFRLQILKKYEVFYEF